MTLDELKNEVTLLGFDDTIDLEGSIIPAANRALRHLYSQRIFTKTVRLFARRANISYYRSEIHCPNGRNTTIPANGKAYSMRLCGSGQYTINDGQAVSVKYFESGAESILVHGFLTWGGSITFWGGYSFTVYDYTIYSEIFSPHAKDIPNSVEKTVFDLRSMYGDFMSFLSPPTNARGEAIPKCTLCDGRVEVDSKYRGEILLTYRILPTKVTSETVEINMPEEYSHLFPLLVASYVILDIDEEKAIRYKSMYDEMISVIKTESYQSVDTAYKNEDGWA